MKHFSKNSPLESKSVVIAAVHPEALPQLDAALLAQEVLRAVQSFEDAERAAAGGE